MIIDMISLPARVDLGVYTLSLAIKASNLYLACPLGQLKISCDQRLQLKDIPQ